MSELRIVIEQERPIDFSLEQNTFVKDLGVVFDTGPGMHQVYHSEDFSGAGLRVDPLELSESFYQKIEDKYGTFTFEQGVSSDEWTIVHNLNRHPSVTVVDSAGTEITCTVQYLDENTCKVSMNAPFKGTAYLN